MSQQPRRDDGLLEAKPACLELQKSASVVKDLISVLKLNLDKVEQAASSAATANNDDAIECAVDCARRFDSSLELSLEQLLDLRRTLAAKGYADPLRYVRTAVDHGDNVGGNIDGDQQRTSDQVVKEEVPSIDGEDGQMENAVEPLPNSSIVQTAVTSPYLPLPRITSTPVLDGTRAKGRSTIEFEDFLFEENIRDANDEQAEKEQLLKSTPQSSNSVGGHETDHSQIIELSVPLPKRSKSSVVKELQWNIGDTSDLNTKVDVAALVNGASRQVVAMQRNEAAGNETTPPPTNDESVAENGATSTSKPDESNNGGAATGRQPSEENGSNGSAETVYKECVVNVGRRCDAPGERERLVKAAAADDATRRRIVQHDENASSEGGSDGDRSSSDDEAVDVGRLLSRKPKTVRRHTAGRNRQGNGDLSDGDSDDIANFPPLLASANSGASTSATKQSSRRAKKDKKVKAELSDSDKDMFDGLDAADVEQKNAAVDKDLKAALNIGAVSLSDQAESDASDVAADGVDTEATSSSRVKQTKKIKSEVETKPRKKHRTNVEGGGISTAEPDPQTRKRSRSTVQHKGDNREGDSIELSSGDDEDEEDDDFIGGIDRNLSKKLPIIKDSDDEDAENDRRRKDDDNEQPSTSSKSSNQKKRKRVVIMSSDEMEEETAASEDDDDFGNKYSSSPSSDEDAARRRSNADGGAGNRKKIVTRATAAKNPHKSFMDVDHGNGRAAPKAKRRRRANYSDESSDEGQTKQSPSKGRKNIKGLLKLRDLQPETQDAAKAEKERKARVAAMQAKYNAVTTADERTLDGRTVKKVLDVVLDRGDDFEVAVNKLICKKLKEHQARAIKFLFNCTFESVKAFNDGSNGGGGILAHCMGLGKTFTVVAFLHTILNDKNFKCPSDCPKDDYKWIHRALVVCPTNVILNWENEFRKWTEELDDEIPILAIWSMTAQSHSTTTQREKQLGMWWRSGGVMVMGYDMYKNLTTSSQAADGKKRKAQPQKKRREEEKYLPKFQQYLANPGPDLIVCDEGHMLKNEKSERTKALNQVRTKRRICLTGTPMQNNMEEYYTMVEFVKPNLLGTKQEFMNRFGNPIRNGGFKNSTRMDIRIMKHRCFVLYKMLDAVLERQDYSILMDELLPKQEYILKLRLTERQEELYQYYLENVVRGTDSENLAKRKMLFPDYHALRRVWSHPYELIKHEIKQALEDNRRADRDFVVSGESTSSVANSSSSEASKSKHRRRRSGSNSDGNASDNPEVVSGWKSSTRGGGDGANEVSSNDGRETPTELRGWYRGHISEEEKFTIELANKMCALFDVIRAVERIGDKLLVFSQSCESLDSIESFLKHYHDSGEWYAEAEKRDSLSIPGIDTWGWKRNVDYYRIDGTVNVADREDIQYKFNDSQNLRGRLLLISTRAGSLGINLVGANRVVIFDACWNPSHDTQALFRVYRFGQQKPVYIYRFIADGTMEDKIFKKQIVKESQALRVVDEKQLQNHFNDNELREFYQYEPTPKGEEQLGKVPEDRLLADFVADNRSMVTSIEKRDTLLQHIEEETLSKEEQEQAWKDYDERKDLDKRQGGPMANGVIGYRGFDALKILPVQLSAAGIHSIQQFVSVANGYLRGLITLQDDRYYGLATAGMAPFFEKYCIKYGANANEDLLIEGCRVEVEKMKTHFEQRQRSIMEQQQQQQQQPNADIVRQLAVQRQKMALERLKQIALAGGGGGRAAAGSATPFATGYRPNATAADAIRRFGGVSSATVTSETSDQSREQRLLSLAQQHSEFSGANPHYY